MKNTLRAALFMAVVAFAASCGSKPSESTTNEVQDTVQADTTMQETPADTAGQVQQDTVSGH
jgi:hypothetical protein